MKPLPKIESCRCKKKSMCLVEWVPDTFLHVRCRSCNRLGPGRKTERGAIEAWNRELPTIKNFKKARKKHVAKPFSAREIRKAISVFAVDPKAAEDAIRGNL